MYGLEDDIAELRAELAAANARAEVAEGDIGRVISECDAARLDAANARRERDEWAARCASAVWLIPAEMRTAELQATAHRWQSRMSVAESERDAALATLARVDAALEHLREGGYAAPCAVDCESHTRPRFCTCGQRHADECRTQGLEDAVAAIAAARDDRTPKPDPEALKRRILAALAGPPLHNWSGWFGRILCEALRDDTERDVMSALESLIACGSVVAEIRPHGEGRLRFLSLPAESTP